MSQGEVARVHGARAKRGTGGVFFVISVPVPSRDSLPERKRRRLLRRLRFRMVGKHLENMMALR